MPGVFTSSHDDWTFFYCFFSFSSVNTSHHLFRGFYPLYENIKKRKFADLHIFLLPLASTGWHFVFRQQSKGNAGRPVFGIP